ncbi:hypothetical protein Q8A67_025772 [Cirrhinus molitorella]|uniref:Uncharacterized protein n=1 Tax=Cirrhinus molitorella TaxID=172907 RepID=A0AA88NY73_9TELE|nr:hypothetical protein Q8A67_025772 [Cirrhinus molitorella]
MVDERQRGTVSESVRPKRQTRHPAYFDDFEVDYGGYQQRTEHPQPLSTARYEHRREQEFSDSREGAQQGAQRTPPRDSNHSSQSTSYPCLPDSRAQSFAASQYRTVNIPEASTPFYERTANVMPAPHSALKGQISASAPPTLYGRSASLDQHASPSFVVSPDSYSPPARTPHYSFSGMSHGANDLSYPPQQQIAPLSEPQSATSMMVLIDKMMGQLQLMRDEVASKHGTPSRSPLCPQQPYKEPPNVHYECPDPPWYSHSSQYVADRDSGPADRFRSSYEPAPRSKTGMYRYPVPLPGQRPKPSWSEQPSIQLKESAAEYRGPKPKPWDPGKSLDADSLCHRKTHQHMSTSPTSSVNQKSFKGWSGESFRR